MTYKRTGYKPGGIRLGEVRPVTIDSLYRLNYEEKKKQRMGEKAYKLEKAIYRQLYRLANKEKINEQQKIARHRRKTFKEAGLFTAN